MVVSLPSRLAAIAWGEYVAALAVIRVGALSQSDLFGAPDAYARMTLWRGVWVACEREAARVSL